MLILSKSIIRISGDGSVEIEGALLPHLAKISHFIEDLGLSHATIRFRFGRFVFSGNIDGGTRQRLRNFLVNECPMRE